MLWKDILCDDNDDEVSDDDVEDDDCDDNHQFELTSRSRSSSWKEILSGSWSWWSRRSKGGLNSEHANSKDGGHVDVDVDVLTA